MKALLRMRLVLALAVALVAGAAGTGIALAKPPFESLSTGVGVDERFAHPDYSLLMMFAEAKGPYLANIEVEIKDARGKVVFADPAAGPWLFAKLPPGEYRVLATRPNGKESGAAFIIDNARQETVRVTW